MSYRLFVDSSTGVSLDPTYEFERRDTKVEDQHRTRSGARYVYKWGQYAKFKVPVEFVSSADASQVNSWWGANTKLLFKNESDSTVFSVQIVNKNLPMGEYQQPYDDLFNGVIELEGY